MKNAVFAAIGAMYFALAFFIVSACLSSCTKDAVTMSNPDQALEIKNALDSMSVVMRAPELALSLDEINLAMNDEHPLQIATRDNCEPTNFKRVIQGVGGSTKYRVNIITVLDYLSIYGTSVSSIDPRDTNNDDEINMIDFLTVLSHFGNSFELVPLSQIETVGGEVSGTGELALMSEVLTVDDEPVEILSIFEGSNCFIQDYESDDFDPVNCYDQTMLTVVTNIGTIKYFHIN